MLYEWRKIWVSLRTQTEFLRLDEGAQLTWFRLILVGSEGEGVCPTVADLAWEWRVSDAEALRRVQSLAGLGWVRMLADDRVEIVRWNDFQGPDSDSVRAKRRRERRQPGASDTKRDKCDTKRDKNDTLASRCGHANDTLRYREELEETRGDESLAPSERLSLSGTPPAASKKRKPLGDVIEPEKRDLELAEFFDLYRFAFATNTRPQSFWGRNKIAEGYRAKASEVIKALGLQQVLASLGGAYFSPYWQGKRFSLENAVSVKALNASLSDWQRQTSEKRAEFAREFNTWRAAQ